MCELYLNDEDEYGVDESAVGVLVPPLLRAVRHVVDAHDAGHGARQVHDVLLCGLANHGSPIVLGKRLPLPLPCQFSKDLAFGPTFEGDHD